MKKLLFTSIAILIFTFSFAQIDREFWFAVPEASTNHGDQPMYLRISAFSKNAKVIIDVPATSSFKPINLTVKANESETVNLTQYKGLLECITPNSIKSNGLRIRSNQVVSVYYEIDNSLNRDIFTLKGRSGLGTEFFTPFQNVYDNGTFVPLIYSSIDVVATEDNTAITLTPTKALYGTGLNIRKIVLDKGETYSFRAASSQASNHLTGTEIQSNKPIAVTIKDDSVDPIGTCKDMVGDQLVPTDILGTEYVVKKGQLTFADEYFFVLAVKDGTTIQTNGGGNFSLSKGQSASIKMSRNEYFVEANKPIYVFHLSGFGCETGGAIIPPLKCTGANSVSFARSSTESLYINLVVPAGKESYFKFNGNGNIIQASGFSKITGTNDWVAGQFEITNGVLSNGSVGKITNDSARFQLGVINGGGSTGAKYGYFSPFSSLNLGDNASLCFGENIILDAGFGFDTILWNTNATSQLLLVDTPGTYSVRTATRNGCVLYDTVNVYISPKPEIITNDSVQCLINNKFNFGTSSLSTSTYSWRIDGKIISGDTSSYSFATTGIKTIWLRSTTDLGCTDSASATVELLKHPSSQIEFSQKMACIDEELTIKNSFIVNSTGMNYKWNLGDGSLSTDKLVKHRYASSGLKKVELIVVDSNGCTDTTTNSIVSIQGVKADFTINDTAQCLDGNKFTFKASNNNGSYNWDLGNGATSSAQVLNYPYVNAGPYDVVLAIIDGNNCHDTISKSIVVYENPLAEIIVNDSAQCPYENNFIFVANTSITTGTLIHSWDLGDKTQANGDTIVHSYKQFPGSKTITLVSTSNKGCSNSVKQVVTIDPQPLADFQVNDTFQCLSGNLFDFGNNSSISSGLLSANWTFGDGSTSNLTSPAHRYLADDTFLVTLIAFDKCVDTATMSVVVYPQPQTNMLLNDSIQCFNEHEFEITSLSTLKHGSLANVWSLGNGSTKTDSTFNYQYQKWGTYKLKLISTSSQNCKDSQRVYLKVYPSPKADFSLNNSRQCFNENSFISSNTSFIDSGALAYSWSFGNGTLSNNISDTFIYAKEGSYQVSLLTNSALGCADTLVKTALVHPSPQTRFSVSDSLLCISNNQFVFTNSSQISTGTLAHEWFFDDSNFSTLKNPTHQYQYADTFMVSLVSTSDSNCTDTALKTLVVWDRPDINFALNDTDQCLVNNLFIGTNRSTTYQDSLLFVWQFGDGNTAISLQTQHSYNAAGRFELKLIGSTNTGCTDSFSRMVDVFNQPAPNAGFNLESDSAQCLKGNAFTLQNLSDINSGKLRLVWKPDDGRVVEDSILELSYSYADTFSFRLIAISEFGCKDSIERNLYVWPQAAPKLSFSSPLCVSDSITISDSSKIEWGSLNSVLEFNQARTNKADTNITVVDSGFYLTTIFTNSNYGCKDTLTDSFWVNGKVQPEFNFRYFYNNNVQLVNRSKSGFVNFKSWVIWPDGAVDSNAKYIAQIDSADINKGVRLYIESDSGCVIFASDTPIFEANYPTIAYATRALDTATLPVDIHWQKDARAEAYNIYFTNDTPMLSAGTTTDTFFSDLTFVTGKEEIHTYVVQGIDSLGGLSDTSARVKNIALNSVSTINETNNSISWTPYGYNWKSGFEYIIYNYQTSGLQELARVKDNQLSFKDSSTNTYNASCYRIAAINTEGYESWSNVLCNDFIYWIPNAFSPNGDGLNDEFSFFTNGLYDIEMTVFASSGQRVFSAKGFNRFWDGKLKGETAPLSTYLWVLKGNRIENGQTIPVVLKGNLEIIR